jgi:V8-like Glu-specific endopeptidase
MEMTQLLEFDPGLKSRFGTDSSMITFPDYTETEMLSIMRDMASKAKSNPQIAAPRNLTLSDEYCNLSRIIFSEICAQRDPRFGNARFVRNYLNDSVDCLLERLDEEEEIDYHLTAEDIPPRFSKYKPATDKSKPAPLLPATLVKGLISTEPVKELITDRMMRHYTPNFTVYLEASKNGQPYGSGTGTIISKEGHILTCEHVVDGADRIRARVYAPGTIGGDYHWFNCQVLHPTAKDIDMALLKMDGSNFPAATLRPEGAPIDECERILLSGFPLGSQLSNYDAENLRISHFFGNISSIQHRETETVFADITGLQGNSGSPVFSMDDGRVIGVFTGSVTHKSEQLTEENNYFHPIQLFWERFTVDLS